MGMGSAVTERREKVRMRMTGRNCIFRVFEGIVDVGGLGLREGLCERMEMDGLGRIVRRELYRGDGG